MGITWSTLNTHWAPVSEDTQKRISKSSLEILLGSQACTCWPCWQLTTSCWMTFCECITVCSRVSWDNQDIERCQATLLSIYSAWDTTPITPSCPHAAWWCDEIVVSDLPVDSSPFLMKLPLMEALLGEKGLSGLFPLQKLHEGYMSLQPTAVASLAGCTVFFIYKVSMKPQTSHH